MTNSNQRDTGQPRGQARVIYVKISDDVFGIEGPTDLMEDGAVVDVTTKAGDREKEIVGKFVNESPDGRKVHMKVPVARYRKLPGGNTWGIRGPTGLMVEGATVPTLRQSGEKKTEIVGAYVEDYGEDQKLHRIG